MSNNNFARDTLQENNLLLWYRIKHVLGKGGFGITYLATDINLDRDVAIKEYLPSEMASRADSNRVTAEPNFINEYEDGLKRFIREARTIAKFDHANVAKVLNVFEENGTAYMVMAYERGKDLKDYLKQNKTLDEAHLLEIIVPILEGLELVHEAGFIHRDIKPGNIMIREDGSPVLIDFGSAHDTKKSTKQVTTLVSPGFTPHEQYTGQANAQGPWTDIYSLGATLYKCISGRNPVDALTRGSALIKNNADPLVSAREIGQGKYSDSLLAAIDHALAFNEENRPRTIPQWTSELLGTSHSQGISNDIKQQADARRKSLHSIGDTQEMAVTQHAIKPPVKITNPAKWIAAASVVIGLVAGIVFLAPGDAESGKAGSAIIHSAATQEAGPGGNEQVAGNPAVTETEEKIDVPVVYQAGMQFQDRLKAGLNGPKMVVLPSGEFNIGSQINEQGRSNNEGPQKKVSLRRPIAISKTEVTVGQFRMFVEATGYVTEAEKNPEVGCRIFDNGWRWEANRNWREHRYEQSDRHPVVCVSWDDALAYIDWLTEQTGELYSLPSEVEWEYAARSGSQKSRFWEEEEQEACGYANVSDLSRARMSNLSRSPENIFVCDDGYAYSAPVASFQENNFGINDMLGNVWEWTADCWNDNYDDLPQVGQPRLHGNCSNRVYRGGSWGNFPALIRAAKRGTDPKEFRYYNVGFRVTRHIDQEASSAIANQKLSASRLKI